MRRRSCCRSEVSTVVTGRVAVCFCRCRSLGGRGRWALTPSRYACACAARGGGSQKEKHSERVGTTAAAIHRAYHRAALYHPRNAIAICGGVHAGRSFVLQAWRDQRNVSPPQTPDSLVGHAHTLADNALVVYVCTRTDKSRMNRFLIFIIFLWIYVSIIYNIHYISSTVVCIILVIHQWVHTIYIYIYTQTPFFPLDFVLISFEPSRHTKFFRNHRIQKYPLYLCVWGLADKPFMCGQININKYTHCCVHAEITKPFPGSRISCTPGAIYTYIHQLAVVYYE